MARLLYGNFDFEHELATPHYNRPQRLARLNAELAPCLLALAGPGDQIWCPEPLSDGPARGLADAGLPSAGFLSSCSEGKMAQELPVELAPWGWSRAAVAFARQAEVEVPHVDLDAVRTANSRGFSFSLETSLEVAPRGTLRLESSRQLVEALAESAAAWGRPAAEHRVVLKAEFGMSGRERISLRGDEVLTPSVHGWINRRIEQSGAVYLEPWLDRVAELSTHWEIFPPQMPAGNRSETAQAVRPIAAVPVERDSASDEQLRFVGQTQLLNTPHGQYVGSRVGAVATDISGEDLNRLLAEIETTAEQVAAAVSRLGYTGPVGIDAMIYRDADGCLKTRPVQDINARWSMGRVALALQQRLAPAGCASLLKIPAEHPQFSTASPGEFATGAKLLRLTPRAVGEKSCTEAMVALWAESPAELLVAEQQLLAQVSS